MLVFWSSRGPRAPMAWGGCVGAAGYPMGCQIGRLTRHETPLPVARPSQATKISKPNRFAYPFRSRPRGVRKERGGPLFSIWHRPRRLVIEIRQIWGSVSPPVPVVTRTISGQESPIAVASLTSGAGFCWQRGAHLTWPRCGSRRVSQNRSGSAPQLGWRRRFP